MYAIRHTAFSVPWLLELQTPSEHFRKRCQTSLSLRTTVIVIQRFYTALFSALEQIYSPRSCRVWFWISDCIINPFTAVLAVPSLGKWLIAVPNLKSSRLLSPFARAHERISIQWHSIKRISIQWHSIERISIQWHSIERIAIQWHSIERIAIQWHSIGRIAIQWHSIESRFVLGTVKYTVCKRVCVYFSARKFYRLGQWRG